MSCDCGTNVQYSFHQLACTDCGAACCPSCAVHLESVTYCQDCAGSLLGTPALRSDGQFDLH